MKHQYNMMRWLKVHMEEGGSTRCTLHKFTPLSAITVQRTVLQLLQQVTSLPKWDFHLFLVVLKILHVFLNCLAICKVAHTFFFFLKKSMFQ